VPVFSCLVVVDFLFGGVACFLFVVRLGLCLSEWFRFKLSDWGYLWNRIFIRKSCLL